MIVKNDKLWAFHILEHLAENTMSGMGEMELGKARSEKASDNLTDGWITA